MLYIYDTLLPWGVLTAGRNSFKNYAELDQHMLFYKEDYLDLCSQARGSLMYNRRVLPPVCVHLLSCKRKRNTMIGFRQCMLCRMTALACCLIVDLLKIVCKILFCPRCQIITAV